MNQSIGHIDARVFIGLHRAVSELRIDVEPLMEQIGIPATMLREQTGTCNWQKFSSLLELIAEKHNCPNLGILVGKYQPIAKQGLVIQMLRLCPDLRTALNKTVIYSVLYSTGVNWSLMEYETGAVFKQTVKNPHGTRYVQICTLGVVQTVKTLWLICGQDWRPASISFTFTPGNAHLETEYRTFFRTNIHFNDENTAIRLSNNDLDRALPGADGELLTVVEDYARSLLREQSDELGVIDRIRFLVKKNLSSHSNCKKGDVARSLQMTPKSLQRLLAARGFTFREILFEERNKIAQYYLLNSDINLYELADILGYSDATALSRAFKIHCGISPDAWRRQNRISSGHSL